MQRLIGGLDTETTGLKFGDHRFVEVCLTIFDMDTKALVKKLHTLIDPERSIPAEALKIHRITPADVMGKPKWDTVGPNLNKAMNLCSRLVIHNSGFDMPFLNYEFDRIGQPAVTSVPVTDTFLESRWATPNGKAPNLMEFCFATGVDYDMTKNHRADYDVEVMMQGYFNAVDWGYFSMEDAENAQAA